jgi:hypothetical protein
MGYILKFHLKKVCGCFPKVKIEKEELIQDLESNSSNSISSSSSSSSSSELNEIVIHHEQPSQTIPLINSSDAEETSSSTPSQSRLDEGAVMFLKKYAQNNRKKLYEVARRNNAKVIGLYHGPFRGSTLESCVYTWPAHNEQQIKEIFEHQNIFPYYIFHTL